MITEELTLEFQRTVEEVFGENLVFAFIFGSFAKGYAREAHDLDTFICVQIADAEQQVKYLSWLQDLHSRRGLILDPVYPCELMTYAVLRAVIEGLVDICLSLDSNSAEVFDAIVWGEVLAGQKSCIVGDSTLLAMLQEACSPYPAAWKDQLMQELRARDEDRAKSLQHREPVYFLQKVAPFERKRACHGF